MIAKTLLFLERHTYLLYVILAILTVITISLTLLPSDKLMDARIFRYDKAGHLLMFGSWTFLLGLIQLVSDRQPLPLFAIFLAGSLFGITVELMQEVLPGDRDMNIYDAVADIIGCFFAVSFLKIITIYSVYGKNKMEQ
jgi:VanZ family protein